MKITKRQLGRLIKEEKQRLLKEDVAEEFREIQSDLMMLGSDIFKGKTEYAREEIVGSVAQSLASALWLVKHGGFIDPQLAGEMTPEELEEAWRRAVKEVDLQ